MVKLSYILLTSCILTACGGAGEKAREAIKDSGEIVGKTVGEFGKGVSEGLEETFQIRINLSDALAAQGIELGKIDLDDDSGGTDNILVDYMMFEHHFNDTIVAMVYDTENLEMGRSSQTVAAKAGEATFFEFHFDKRTNIDSDSKVTME